MTQDKNKGGYRHFMKMGLSGFELMLFLCYGVALVGIFYSTFLTTVGLAASVLLSFRYFFIEKAYKMLADRQYLPYVLLFVVALLSGLNSEDAIAWQTDLRIKLPFLVLPIAFYMMPPLSEKLMEYVHHLLLGITVLVGIPVLFYAIRNHSDMLELLSKGQPIPTPIEHVKYSMFNAYAAITGLYFLVVNWSRLQKLSAVLIGAGVVFLIVLLHVLAVRTGLLIFYVSLLLLMLYAVFKFKSKWLNISMVLAIFLLPLFAYQTIPSIKQKIGYMRYDWAQFKKNNGMQYSDSERLMTASAAIAIWKENLWFGIGHGDVKMEMVVRTQQLYGTPIDKLPHSQFLLYLTGSGVVGLLLFIIGFYRPLVGIKFGNSASILLLILYLNYTLSFLVENSLERSMSVAFFLLMGLMLIKANSLNQAT